MKQKKKCIVLALVMSLVLSNVYVPQVEAKSKAPSVKKSITLTVGQKKTIRVTGSKIKSKKFKVTSGKKVVSLSKKGTVKAKKKGTAKIKVTVKYKSGKKVKSKKLYVKVKVVNKVTNTTVTNKPSVTTKPSTSSTAPSVTTSTPSAKPSEEPSAKPTETPSAKPSEEPSATPSEEPSSTPSETPSAEPTETPALDLNENGLVVKSGRLTSYSGSAKTLSIPEGVTEIAENALEDAEVKSIELPSTLQTIGARAFKGCSNLEDIDCPDTVVGVGDYACEDCTALESISIPNEEAEIGEAILEGCVNLTSAYIPAASGCSHEYMKIKIDANCTQNGTNISICKDCGDIVNNTVNALGHDIEIIRIEPTCVKDGMEKKVCKRCDAIIDVTTIDALGHDYKDEVINSTCTEKGYTKHTCSRCSDTYKDSYVDELGHDYNSVVTDPTCTEKGYTAHTCSRCDDTYKDSYVDALGHDFIGWVTNIPATCTENGQQVGVCSRCSLESFKDLLATGHVAGDFEVVIPATCTEKGKQVKKCTVCNEIVDEQEIPAKGHSWGTPTYNWVEDGSSCKATRICESDASHVETEDATITSSVKVQPTCTEKGTTTYTAKFENNGFSVQTKDVVDIRETGHSWEEPTYTWSDDGKSCIATRVCSNDSSHVETENAEITSEVKTSATCTEDGITTYTAQFSNKAFSTQTKDIKDIPAIGHDYDEPTYSWSATGDKCTATRVCKHDNSHVETESGEVTSTVKVPATCEEKGTTKYTATFENKAFTSQTKDIVDISAAGHKWGSVEYSWSADNRNCTATRVCENNSTHTETETSTVKLSVKTDATCEVDGTTTYTAEFENTVFKTQTKDIQDIDAIGHSYGEPTYTWSSDGKSCVAKRICNNNPSHIDSENAKITSSVKIEPDCTTKGTTTYTATFENEAFEGQTKDVVDINALGHDYDSVVVDPTCLSNGYTSHTCSRCIDNYVSNMVPATGHDYGTPTYTWGDDGKTCTAKVICNNDNSHIIVENAVITSAVKTEATCTVKGTTTYTATFSNELFTTQTKDVQDIPAKGHSWGSPTYTWSSDGKTCTAKRVCSKNSSHTETESAKITSAVKTAATCTTKGTTRYTAKFTNSAFSTQTKDVQDIAAKGHSKSYSVNIAYSGSEGNVRYLSIRCSRCNTTLSASEAYFTSGSEYSLGSYSEVPASYNQDSLTIYQEATSSSSPTNPAKDTQTYTYLRGFDDFDTESNATSLANFLVYRLCSDSCGKTLLIDDIDGSKSTNAAFFSRLTEQGFTVIVLD